MVPGGAMRFNEDGNRAIGIALLLSIALHGLLLFALAGLREAQQSRSLAREPIAARLLRPRIEPVTPSVPQLAPQEPRKPVRPPEPKPAPKAGHAAEPAPTQPPQTASAESAAPVIAMAPAVSAPPASPAAAVAPAPVARAETGPAASASNALDAGTLAQYRLAIISAAKLYKRYPRAALDNNWQGKVEIRMAIGANGAIAGLSVRTSAGHAVLDQQALEMIERAKAMSPIPPALRGREFVVDIPVIFSLREPDA